MLYPLPLEISELLLAECFLEETIAFVSWILCFYEEQTDHKGTSVLRTYTSALTIFALNNGVCYILPDQAG